MSGRLPGLGTEEQRLLLTCARVELDAHQAATVGGQLRRRLDWEALLFFARLHSVAPLLHRHINRQVDPEVVPAEPRRRLLALAQGTAYRNRLLAEENGLLLDALHALGIRVAVPKGLPLAERVYGSLGLRPLIDLIFLVAEGDLPRVEEALLAQGYRSKGPVRLVRAVHEWSCPSRWYVKHEGVNLEVLVQTDLVNWPAYHRLTPERVWGQARPASLGGRDVLVLSPIDLVLYLCLQADGNGYFNRAALGRTEPTDLLFGEWSNNRLIRFTDVHEAIRHHRREIDWDHLVTRARSCRIEDAVHASLRLTDRLLGSSIPASALRALATEPRPRLRRALLEAIVADPGRPSAPRPLAFAWRRLGTRRQIDLFRLIGLLEMAFPGRRAIGADQRSDSGSRLWWLAARHAAVTLARSARAGMDAWALRKAALTGDHPLGGSSAGAADPRTTRGQPRPRTPTPAGPR